MKIDFYEKLFLGLTIATLAVFMAAVAYAVSSHQITLVHPVAQIAPADVRTTPPFDQPGLRETAPGEYRATLVARMWAYDPYADPAVDSIALPTGAKVTFELASPDVIHGFKILNTDVNVMVIPGQVSQISHTFDEPGTYLAVCHEYCGAGHQFMYVNIVVGGGAAAAQPAGGDA